MNNWDFSNWNECKTSKPNKNMTIFIVDKYYNSNIHPSYMEIVQMNENYTNYTKIENKKYWIDMTEMITVSKKYYSDHKKSGEKVMEIFSFVYNCLYEKESYEFKNYYKPYLRKKKIKRLL